MNKKIIVLATLLIAFVSFSHCTGKPASYVGEVEVITVTQTFANIHWVNVDGKSFLIDSGMPGRGEKVVEKLCKKGLDIHDIDYLILTHAHPDHGGNARYFQENYGIKVIVGAGEQPMIQAGGRDPELCPRGVQGFLIGRTIARRTYDPFIPDLVIEEKFDLSTIGLTGTIELNPGHTPGSLYIEVGNLAFVGDLIRGNTINKTKPAHHVFICDKEETLNTIYRLSQRPGVTHWHTGHQGALTVSDVRKFVAKNR